jgi:RIM-binding protein of the cytomatrix active zone
MDLNLVFTALCSRQEALEAAISERDSQLALLEVSGIKTAKTAEHADRLKADKKRLMELMKEQVAAHFSLFQTLNGSPSNVDRSGDL